MTDTNAKRLHSESIVMDSAVPLVTDPKYIEWYREGGVTALAASVASIENARTTLDSLAQWHTLLNERDDVMLVRHAGDVKTAKQTGKMGLYFHFQGTDPIEDNLDLIDLYKALGVGIVQLAYNVKNRVGDGCEERTDAGLSKFGIKLVKRLNRARVIVDCTHTGNRTSLDAVEHSDGPVVLSHTNVGAIHPSPRNASDELIRAIGQSGGIIGAVGFPSMVAASTTPSLDQFIAHIDGLVERVGIDCVGLGIDYYLGQAGVAKDEDALRSYTAAIESGIWGSAYPPPPHHYPAGIGTPRTLSNLTERLSERGYKDQDIKKILGENWVRVMKSVWG